MQWHLPESQICQHCAGTSCRFPEALVSRRSYFQSTQTHHNRHPLHSPGSAGSQLKRENKLGEGAYQLLTADCYRRVDRSLVARHSSTSATPHDCYTNHVVSKHFHSHRRSFVRSWPNVWVRNGMQYVFLDGLAAEEHMVTDIPVSFCTAIHLHCLELRWCIADTRQITLEIWLAFSHLSPFALL